MTSIKRKVIAAGLIGNVLDIYDLSIFLFMSSFIAQHLFNSENIGENFVYVFGIFFIGYIARPLGGIIFGLMADRLGRKSALMISIFAMGFATTLIGVLPTDYSFSVLLLVLLRIIQGLAVGGEYINSVTFLFEHADTGQKNFMTSWAAVGMNSGLLLASCVAWLTVRGITHGVLPDWAWRFPFLFAALGAGLGYWFRSSCPETMVFIRNNCTESRTLKSHFSDMFTTLKTKKSGLLLIVLLTLLGITSTYLIYVYSISHVILLHRLSDASSLLINTLSTAMLVALIPLCGYLSDWIGAKRLLLIACLIFAIFSYPFFWALSYGSFSEYLSMQLLITLGAAIFYSIAPMVIIEVMPPRIRTSICSLLYGLAATAFGGSAPLIAVGLIRYTGNPTAPGIYLVLCAIICLIGVSLLMKKHSTRGENNNDYQTFPHL